MQISHASPGKKSRSTKEIIQFLCSDVEILQENILLRYEKIT